MLRVGLTGGIGSGKSTVAAALAGHGALVVDADRIAREVVARGTPGLAALADRFGSGVLTAEGDLDRAALAALAFSDDSARRDLEAITHPRIAARAAELFATARPDHVVVHDVPLLVEKGMGAAYHLVLVVDAPAEVRVARLVGRGLSEADARARIEAQATTAERRAAADVWLDNSGTQADLRATVDRLWVERLAPYEENLRVGRRVKRSDATTLSAPDPDWADRGARVVGRLRHVLRARAVDVEHIGSTSVPGLLAKDVVDVQVGVAELAAADDPGFVAAMRDGGYLLVEGNDQDHPHPADADPRGWTKRFYGGCDPGCVVNVHVRQVGSGGHWFALAFRDWLRSSRQGRAEYAALKTGLGAAHPATADYAAAKEPWFDVVYTRLAAGGSGHASN